MTLTALPTHERRCSECEHGYLGLTGVFCVEFNEPVNDEKADAAACPAFKPIDFPGVTVTVNGVKVDSTIEHRVPTTVEALSDDELVAACDRWLAEQHVTLWGQPFEVISPKGRAQASSWLAKQIRDLGEYRLRSE